ncbi:MAG: hypothetical protein K9J13_15715 [Saprospiraceae bacterium]|nr:hypothetical protein [Saprospiraceae bacterium]
MNILKLKLFKSLIFFIVVFLFSNVEAQEINSSKASKDKPTIFRDSFFTGGGLGFQFGTVTMLDISPLLGYRITEKLSVGVGFKYQYYRYKDDLFEFSTSIYGGSIFSRYIIYDDFFAHAEFELLNYDAELLGFSNITTTEKRITVESYLLGAGYRQRIGRNSYVNFLLLWNFNENVYSLYANPIVRIGVEFGL